MQSQWTLFAVLVLVGPSCMCLNENKAQQATKAYQTACVRMQELAHWMFVVFRIKSVFTRSFSSRTERSPGSTLLPELERSSLDDDLADPSSCSSLRNLRVTAQSYVHLQAQLLQLKALLGGSLLDRGRDRLDRATSALKELQDKIKDLGLLNKTSDEILGNLKLSTEGLEMQANLEQSKALQIVRTASKAPDFFGFLRERKHAIMQHMRKAADLRRDLSQTQSLLVTGDLFQNIGIAMDRLLFSQNTDAD